MILALTEARATDLALVGGKGASLGELTHAGFPVPAGFCVTTAAFRRFVEAAPDPDRLYEALASVDIGDVSAVREVGESVRATLLAVDIPPDVSAAVRRAWETMGSRSAYALRSSATAEDLPDASFAGQQDSFLNVQGEQKLLAAIRRCWASLFTDRAIAYRARNGFDHRLVQLAVVVQQMVMADTSGVVFTADPLTGHRHTVAIDAGFGLGEALVGGAVSPDAYRVDKRRRVILDRQTGDKAVTIVPDAGGGTRQVPLNASRRRASVLHDAQVLEVADLASEIEAYYGRPQDIEWAITGTRVHVLQSRPITSLYPLDGLGSQDGTLHIFLSLGHQQSMTRAMTPVSLSTIRTMMPIGHDEGPFENSYVRASGGRLFADITTPLRHPVLRRPILGLLAQLDALAPEAAHQAMQRPEFQGHHGLRIPLSTLKRAIDLPRRVIGGILWRDLSGVVAHTDQRMDSFVERLSRRYDRASKGAGQITAVLDTLPTVFPFFLHWVPEAVAGIAAARILTRFASGLLEPNEVAALTLAIPGNVVNEMNVAIDDLAELAQGTPELVAWCGHLGEDGRAWLAQAEQLTGGSEFIEAWNRFIARYGMRGPAEIDIAGPRWHEDPVPVLRVIAARAHHQVVSQRTRRQTYVDQRATAMKNLVARGGNGIFGPLRVRLLKRLYYTMTEVGGMREHHKFLAVRVLGEVKEVLKDVAGQLMAADMINDADDIWYLTWAELATVWERSDVDWAALTENRRSQLEQFRNLTPPLIITSDGEAPVVNHRLADAPAGALVGNPVSAGVVEGRTRVVRDPQRESLVPGEVLVAEFTDPGWTPLFINAGALVLEVGGALTHGAVVAREYGIPAVVGVRGATATLHTGQRVRVDGNRGVVEVLVGAESPR